MMSRADERSDAVILQTMRPNLEAAGFRVVLHPSRSVLPPFMRGYQPDAIALKNDKNLAIEVVSRPDENEARRTNLQAMFAGHPDWELRIVYAPIGPSEQGIAIASKPVVKRSLDRVLTIFDTAGPIPALLTAWSVFEAAARSAIPVDLRRPQPPERLLEVLASEGYLTPDEADSARRLGRLRNEAAHGGLDVSLTRADLESLVAATRTLLDAAAPGE